MRISVSLTDEQLSDIKDRANAEGARSIASIIREAVELWLEQTKPTTGR